MIYVDEAIFPFKRQLWCHMFSHDLDALHNMAQRLGLKREYFQDKQHFPHYDLSPAKRALAVKFGAKEVSCEKMISIVRNNKHDRVQSEGQVQKRRVFVRSDKYHRRR